MEIGRLPTEKLVAVAKVPSPLPRRTEMLLLPELTETKSIFPS